MKKPNLKSRCVRVIESCVTKEQLHVAWDYCGLALNSDRLTHDDIIHLKDIANHRFIRDF
jgi:hypothetical protein